MLDLTSRPRTKRPGIVIVLLLALALGGMLYLYDRGGSHPWTPSPYDARLGDKISVDWAKVTEDGNWLLWSEDPKGKIGVYSLKGTEGLREFQTQSSLLHRPVSVIGNHLFVLRTSIDRSFLETVRHGAALMLGRSEPTHEEDSRDSWAGRSRTTHLEVIDLQTGNLLSHREGATRTLTENRVSPLGFEVGRVVFSPDQQSFAWWWAVEEIHGTPISATVVETFRVARVGAPSREDIVKTLSTPGYFEVWSGLLSQVGTPLWIDSTTCGFLSFLDGGSLVPIETEVSDFAATLTLGEMFEKEDAVESGTVFFPEGICVAPKEASEESTLLFWGRDQEEIRFFSFDRDFILSATTSYEIANLDLTQAKWVSDQGRLLVRERNLGDYLVLEGQRKNILRYPSPPFTETEFEVLGMAAGERLVALFDSKFWIADESADHWTELGLSP